LFVLTPFLVTSTVFSQDWRSKYPTPTDQVPSPICTWFYDELPAFDECMSKSNQECWDKCKANNYQDGHCAFRDPKRKPNENGHILSPWGFRMPSYHNVPVSKERCLNPPSFNTGRSYVYATYCRDNGYWKNVNFNGYGFPGILVACRRNVVSAQIMIPPELEMEQVHKDGCNDSEFCVRGRSPIQYTSAPFNTPFIYFDDVEDGAYNVSISSKFDNYRSIPDFNRQNGWNAEIENNIIEINNTEVPHLFYELEVGEISLSRHGENFEGKESFLRFLQESDFYSRLGMNEVEAENSFQYVFDNLVDAPNYYLTVLSSSSVDNISQIEVTDKNNNKMPVGRTYFSIYPGPLEIKTDGPLQFPEVIQEDVREFGEILIDSSMIVFWE